MAWTTVPTETCFCRDSRRTDGSLSPGWNTRPEYPAGDQGAQFVGEMLATINLRCHRCIFLRAATGRQVQLAAFSINTVWNPANCTSRDFVALHLSRLWLKTYSSESPLENAMFYRLPFTKRPVAEIVLGFPGFLRLSGAQSTRIEALSGVVLITFHDVKNDVALHCGENIVVPNNGLALLEGFGKCRIRITRSQTDEASLPASMGRQLMRTFAFYGNWQAHLCSLR